MDGCCCRMSVDGDVGGVEVLICNRGKGSLIQNFIRLDG